MGIREFTVARRGLGLPDYAQPKPVGTVPVGPIYTSTDVAELAVRTGSLDVFDRRGNIVWYDNFEGGIQRWTRRNRAQWVDTPDLGGFSCKLSPILGDIAELERFIRPFMRTGGNCGMEIAFRIPTGTIHVALGMEYYLNGVKTSAKAYISGAPPDSYITHSTGDLIVLSDYYLASGIFHHVKAVANFENQKWVRLLLDSYEVNLDAYDLLAEDTVETVEYAAFWLYFYVLTVPDVGYIDNVILTQNEPPNVAE